MSDLNGKLRAPRVFIYTYVDSQLVALNERVLRVEFEDNLKKVDRATIELNNHDLAVFDDDRWATGSHIYVSYGYYGQMSVPVHMRIKKVSGGMSVTIEAVNAAAFGLDLKKKSKTWEHKSYSAVVKEVAKDNGILSPTVQDLDVVHETITQSNQTDGVFLRELADREGFDFRVVGSSIHWGERDLTPAPVRQFSYYSTADVEANIIDFGIDNDVTRRPGRVKSAKRDPLDRKTVEETADNLNDKDRDVLSGWALTPGDEDGRFTLGVEPTAAEPTTATILVGGASKSAKGAFRAAARGTVKMWISTEGAPTVHAGDVVQVTGLGKRLSGRYVTRCVKHSIEGRGRYMMTLNLTSDGVNAGKKGGGTKISLSQAIARLQSIWERFTATYRGSLETYLEGFESLIQQLDTEITQLSPSSYTHAIGEGIQHRLGVLRDYLYGFSVKATSSDELEEAIKPLIELANSAFAAAGEVVTAVIESGLEKQTGKPNEKGVSDAAPAAITFDNESGQASLSGDPSVVLNKVDTEGETKVTGGTVNNKAMPATMLDRFTKSFQDTVDSGLGID